MQDGREDARTWSGHGRPVEALWGGFVTGRHPHLVGMSVRFVAAAD